VTPGLPLGLIPRLPLALAPGLPFGLTLGLPFGLTPGLPFGLTPRLPFGPHPCNSLLPWSQAQARVATVTHTPKKEKMESSETLKNSEDDLRGQITSPWCIFYIKRKVLKRRCPKWPCMGHLDIYSSSYGQKKGRESNC